MKKLLFTLLLNFSGICFAQVNSRHIYVSPHTRSDGAKVPGHYRTAPNNTNRDNFSTSGNTNPYTGQAGWIAPDGKQTNTNYSPPNDEREITKMFEGMSEKLEKDIAEHKAQRDSPPKNQVIVTNGQLDFLLQNNNQAVIYDNGYYVELHDVYSAILFHKKYDDSVKHKIEEKLSALNYEVGIIDGTFDEQTIRGIRHFQKINDLKVDGRIGVKSLEILGLN